MATFKFQPDLVDSTAWIAEGATVIGEVHLGARSSVWFGAVLRGDTEPIRIGCDTNVQDLCCLHADPGFPCTLGDAVTVGHGAIVHGAVVEDESLIGIRATLLNGVRIGRHSIVGAGSVVPEGRVIPPRSLVLGVPGRVVREISEEDLQRIRHGAQHYVLAAESYRSRR